ncbi:MAG: tRNA (adenosine(37)-N6)-threonylcarbamoyltransferase complex transferase subunit TsaD [Ignavibacteriaceae bacterium]|nr:tRNA (adenosine(37)-N6)-threonylcarbamoyltransferase complex transferase subunit TsaD [Ignavibacteriaceae bacterium]
MNVLGIESSCDETSVAIISDKSVKANLISSQDFHTNFGGVVPELSSRAHLQKVKPLVEAALKKSKLNLNEIDVISSTGGPGLIGALLVGFTFAKGLAFALKKPFVSVNHIDGHIFSGFLMKKKPEFPFLVLVVSGGHTLLLFVKNVTEIYKLGTTVDDAAGEAFDKVGKMLGLGYPGGPQIEINAASGDENKIYFPIADLKHEFNFSFSGLKTAVLRYLQKHHPENKIVAEDLKNICASFQKATVDALLQNVQKALNSYNVKSISLVGGVAANKKLRDEIIELADEHKINAVIPSIEYCGDNGAMIALRAQQLFENGIQHNLNVTPYPSIPPNHFLEFD